MNAPIVAVYSLKGGNREALEAQPAWPVIPMASAFEAKSERRAPLGAFAPKRSVGVQAIAQAWSAVEKAMAKAAG